MLHVITSTSCANTWYW